MKSSYHRAVLFMNAKGYGWNLLILNGDLEIAESISSKLSTLGVDVNASCANSLAHYESSLFDGKWDVIIGLDVDLPSIPLSQALSVQKRCISHQFIPFIVISSDASSDSRVKWISQGANDVVENNAYDLLSCIVNRELDNQDVVSTQPVPFEKYGCQEYQKSLAEKLNEIHGDSSVLDATTLFVIEFHQWSTLVDALDGDQKTVIMTAVNKELHSYFEKENYPVSTEGVVFVFDKTDDPIGIARNITDDFNRLFVDIGDKSYQMAISLVALELKYFKDCDNVLKHVESMLTEVRARGVNIYQIFSPEAELEKQAVDGDAHALVKHALDHKSFRLMFQPIASLKGDSEAHYDVLLRIIDPSGKNISAGQFMGAIDKTPLAEKIDKWVILKSIKKLLKSDDKLKSCLFLHISTASVKDERFLPWLRLLIKKTGVSPSSLIFQLDEESIARFSKEATHTLSEMVKIGCRTSICHFGTTVNPMCIAKDFETDYIKFDGSIINDLVASSEKEKLIKDMINNLHRFGRRTIIPHVENPNVMTRVWRTGSDYVQGHFLQKPGPDMDYDFSSDT